MQSSNFGGATSRFQGHPSASVRRAQHCWAQRFSAPEALPGATAAVALQAMARGPGERLVPWPAVQWYLTLVTQATVFHQSSQGVLSTKSEV